MLSFWVVEGVVVVVRLLVLLVLLLVMDIRCGSFFVGLGFIEGRGTMETFIFFQIWREEGMTFDRIGHTHPPVCNKKAY